MAFDKADVRTGFYVGIGLLLAILVWTFVSLLLGKVVGRRSDG